MPLNTWPYCPYKDTLAYEQERLPIATDSLLITKDQSFYLQDGSNVCYFSEFDKIKITSKSKLTRGLQEAQDWEPSWAAPAPLLPLFPLPPQPQARSAPPEPGRCENSHPHPQLNTTGFGTPL